MSINSLKAILSDETVFICGAAHDLYRYCDYFNTVFLLQYPSAQAIEERLASRTNNSYGKDPKELADILSYWKDYEQKYTTTAHIIDCTEPLPRVIHTITSAID